MKTDAALTFEQQKEKLIELFKFGNKPGTQANLSYDWRKQYYRDDKPLLDALLSEGRIKIIQKTSKRILFHLTESTN